MIPFDLPTLILVILFAAGLAGLIAFDTFANRDILRESYPIHIPDKETSSGPIPYDTSTALFYPTGYVSFWP